MSHNPYNTSYEANQAPPPPPYYGQPINPYPPYPNSNPIPPPPMYGQHFPPPSNNIQIINHQNPQSFREFQYQQGNQCVFCRSTAPPILLRKPGPTAYVWCLVLFCFTGFLCCLPFCIDGCQDSHLVCPQCQNSRNVIPANFC